MMSSKSTFASNTATSAPNTPVSAPATEGRDYELLPENALKSLEPWRNHFTIISNTDVRMAEAFSPAEVGGDHFRSAAVFLTQSHPKQTQGSDIVCGISMDQLHAQRFAGRACGSSFRWA